MAKTEAPLVSPALTETKLGYTADDPGPEKMYWLGLLPDAPMHSITVPTDGTRGFKAVTIPRHTRALDTHDVKPNMMILGSKIPGQKESLYAYEHALVMKYIREHGFFVMARGVEKLPEGQEIPWTKCNEIQALDAKAPSSLPRSPRSEAKSLEPLANYVWILAEEDRGRYSGNLPPTVAQMDAASKTKQTAGAGA